MIARFQVLLPYAITIAPGHNVAPFETEAEGNHVRVYPPHKAKADKGALNPDSLAPITEIGRNLAASDDLVTTTAVLLDDAPTIQADVFQIDFLRDEFDRTPESNDPPQELCFQLANRFLAGLRTLGRSGFIKPLADTGSIWTIRYLTDDERELEPQEGRIRARSGASWNWTMLGVAQPLWQALQELPDDFEPTAWDTLLLDALNSLPEVGPSIVLAFAAIETRIDSALDLLASESLDPDFWDWIRDREGDYRKEPAVREQLDQLLHGVSGHSLKDEATLWMHFRNLNQARNTFVHEGEARIGDTPVDYTRASELVRYAGDIIDWIETLLPENQRRPQYDLEASRMQLMKVFVAPSPTVAEPAQGSEEPHGPTETADPAQP